MLRVCLRRIEMPCVNSPSTPTQMSCTPTPTQTPGGSSPRMNSGKPLTNDQRNAILQELLIHAKDADGTDSIMLKRGAIQQTANRFRVSRVSVSKIWAIWKRQRAAGNVSVTTVCHKKKNCGRKRKDYATNFAAMRDIPLNERGTVRSLSSAIKIPKSTLFERFAKDREIKRVSSAVKPFLTEHNKRQRLDFCISKVQPNGHFHDFYDAVHIDEKWFYLTQTTRSYYLLPDEETPHRTCKSKRFVTKVMFMAAVARPRFDRTRNQWFDGKLGIWPFVTQEPAKRNSKNRARGTLVTKNIESVNAVECKRMLIDNVFPAIRSKFPRTHRHRPVYIQQDNARPHPSPDDPEVVAAGVEEGWNLRLTCQSPNSPDFNVLDLGFFNSIQSLQHQASPKTIDDLIACVENAFYALDKDKLDDVFLTLQKCLECTMFVGGGNSYQLPHLQKAKLRRESSLPTQLVCSPEALAAATSTLSSSK